ncbi:unnamed protein product [Prorocentrum cordatum]|uniref:Uncharacterized protein n=1 Tax=Prorocentrum cordatum TaxID=2364126 RepID=A0ABN9Y7N6_9DINO|nr:unnamed protein product [Polarella glacialis]
MESLLAPTGGLTTDPTAASITASPNPGQVADLLAGRATDDADPAAGPTSDPAAGPTKDPTTGPTADSTADPNTGTTLRILKCRRVTRRSSTPGT